MKRASSRLGPSCLTLLSLTAIGFGCNAILDNDEGNLVVTDEAGADAPEPGTLEPGDEDAGGLPSIGDDDTGAPCPEGQRLCSGACVSSTDPAFGCGAASCAPCALANADAVCALGACAIAACKPGFDDCNKDLADGCEGDLSRPETCGRCDVVCPATAPRCTPSATPGSFSCTTGCSDQAPLLCEGVCVDPKSSAAHCGRCGNACGAIDGGSTACVDGTCEVTCVAGSHACGGACALDTDVTACGPRCRACPTPAHATAACTANACAFTCLPGFADCDTNPDNGCEVELATNPLHCGTCATTCNGGTCVGGVCQAPVSDAGPDARPPIIVLPF